ncbi:MAG: DUF4294 domain-containing protein [Bacteroidales bacterium]|nr:DUF4294 domain-containing protein [Bacteroidales bacterium]
MKSGILIILTILLFIPAVYSQAPQDGIIVVAEIHDDDTLIVASLPEYCVTGKLKWKFKKELRRHDRLVYNVKKVYPYAKLAGIKLNEYETVLLAASNDQERRKIMKEAEDELRVEFEDDIKKLTFTQGAILIKLVDRETGNSSYALIQELRGKFVAFFWQTFARLFGYNLKQEYDPTGADKEIEEIVVMIEKGQI